MDASSRGPARRDSLRHVRRMSNWTAATLIVGTGAAAVALAQQVSHPAAPVLGAAAVPAGAVPAGANAAGANAAGGTGPAVNHSVATTTASGVTVTTTTRTVNGRTVVTQVRHAPAGGDN